MDFVLEFDELQCILDDEDCLIPEYCPFCGEELLSDE